MIKDNISNSETKILIGQVKLKVNKPIDLFFKDDSLDSDNHIELIIPASDVNTVRKIQKGINISIEKGIKSHLKDLNFLELKLPIKYACLDNNQILQVKISRFSKFVNYDKTIISNPKGLYSGCLVRASIFFYPFNNEFGRGINAELSTLEKMKDGEI